MGTANERLLRRPTGDSNRDTNNSKRQRHSNNNSNKHNHSHSHKNHPNQTYQHLQLTNRRRNLTTWHKIQTSHSTHQKPQTLRTTSWLTMMMRTMRTRQTSTRKMSHWHMTQ